MVSQPFQSTMDLIYSHTKNHRDMIVKHQEHFLQYINQVIAGKMSVKAIKTWKLLFHMG